MCDLSSDVCSSALRDRSRDAAGPGSSGHRDCGAEGAAGSAAERGAGHPGRLQRAGRRLNEGDRTMKLDRRTFLAALAAAFGRSEEHTSELQSLMRISYAVFCLKKKKKTINTE